MGDKMLAAFSSPSAIPFSSVNLESGKGVPSEDGYSSTAEEATIQLEFSHLSKSTQRPTFKEKSDQIMEHLLEIEPVSSLVPIFIEPPSGFYHVGKRP